MQSPVAAAAVPIVRNARRVRLRLFFLQRRHPHVARDRRVVHGRDLNGRGRGVRKALPVAGGWLTVGIPEYRLPKDIINAEIKIITDLGVDIKLNTCVGTDVHLADLKRDYDALFLGVGSQLSVKLDLPGDEQDGVFPGIDYLKRVNLGEKIYLGEKVAVVGGGNVAMDAARTAVRSGSTEVRQRSATG